MSRTEEVDNTIRHYLLGGLTEPEQAQLESEYFGDKEKFEEVCAIENDLIDDYLRGNLSAGDREQFERRYLSSPERLRRVRFAGSMLQSLYGTSTAAARAPRFLFAGMPGRWKLATTPVLVSVALVLAAAVGLLVIENLRLKRALMTSEEAVASESQREQELRQQLAEQRAGSEHLTKELETLRAQTPQQQTISPNQSPLPAIASFVLRPGLIRGGAEPQTLLIPPGVDVVELRLNLRTIDFKKYTGNLLTPEGTVLRKQPVKMRQSQAGGTVVVRVPAKLIPPGDYILRLDGINPTGEISEAADSYFRVASKTGSR